MNCKFLEKVSINTFVKVKLYKMLVSLQLKSLINFGKLSPARKIHAFI